MNKNVKILLVALVLAVIAATTLFFLSKGYAVDIDMTDAPLTIEQNGITYLKFEDSFADEGYILESTYVKRLDMKMGKFVTEYNYKLFRDNQTCGLLYVGVSDGEVGAAMGDGEMRFAAENMI